MSETKLEPTLFGTFDGQEVHAAQISNANGLSARFITFGARLTGLWLPDRDGRLDDVVLGFDSFQEYVETDTYFGATVGRYGNRIGAGRFAINGEDFKVDCNEHGNHLHGGREGFDRKIWKIADHGASRIVFTALSEDGEMGFPGRCVLRSAYELTDDDRLLITLEAETDRPTLMNMVNHAYFNLRGQGNGDVLDHVVRFGASFYTPVDDALLATGEVLSVSGTPFDFTTPKTIGRDIEQLAGVGGEIFAEGGGYDHNLCLDGTDDLRFCIDAYDPGSGRRMVMHTSEPGVQFYTGGYLSDAVMGKAGKALCKHAGFTLETQKFPGTPVFGHFPQCRLAPGDTYRNRVVFAFGTDKEDEG